MKNTLIDNDNKNAEVHNMEHEKIDQGLDQALGEFKSKMDSHLLSMGLNRDQAIKKGDIEYLSKQLHDCLSAFKEVIVNCSKIRHDKG